MKPLIYFTAIIAATLTVLSTRLLIPALTLCFKAIEASFSPDEETSSPVLVAAATPVVATEAKRSPRKAKRRRPSKALLAKVEAIA